MREQRLLIIFVAFVALPPGVRALRGALRRWARRREVDVVVKFGGSAITQKQSFETLDAPALKAAASAVAVAGTRARARAGDFAVAAAPPRSCRFVQSADSFWS